MQLHDAPRIGRRLTATVVFLLLALSTTVSHAQTFEWAKRAGSPDLPASMREEDRFAGIAADTQGNSYVTGFFIGTATFGAGEPNATQLTSAGSTDIVIAKYAADGRLGWARRAGGGDSDGSKLGQGIAIDDSGNSYVTGVVSSGAVFGPGERNQTTLTDGGGFLAKYDANGSLVWVRPVAEGNGDGVAVDVAGNIYLTGLTVYPDHIDSFVEKRDSTGGLIWARQIGGGQCLAIAVDGQQNSYVAGFFGAVATFDGTVLQGTTDGQDILLAKYDRNGALSFATAAGGTGLNRANGVAVDDQGNAYITGMIDHTAMFGSPPNQISLVANARDVFVAKYATDGRLIWAKQAGGLGDDKGMAITLGGPSTVYVTGVTAGPTAPITFGRGEVTQTTLAGEAFVAEYANDGSFVWAKAIGGQGNVQPFGVAADRSGDVYLAGNFLHTAIFGGDQLNYVILTTAGSLDMFVAKYNASALIDDKVSFSVQDTSFDPSPVLRAPAGVFTINAILTNTSTRTIGTPVRVIVNTLSMGDVLLTATQGNGGNGSKQDVDVGVTDAIRPGESRPVQFRIGLATRNAFTFLVDVEGVL